jgi:hypothetical protein
MGHLGAILGPFWATWGNLEPLGAMLGPSSAILDHLGALWGHLGTILHHLGAIFGHLKAKTPKMTTVSRF